MTLEEWRAWCVGKLVRIAYGFEDEDATVGICYAVNPDGVNSVLVKFTRQNSRGDLIEDTYWVERDNRARSWHLDVYGEERR